jgi:putative tryptophan/tyrosine transport system substrate-binding protein
LSAARRSRGHSLRARQPDRVRRIAVLMGFAEGDPEAQRYIKAFLQGLQQLGWAQGRNVQIDYRWGRADPERIKTYAVEIVQLKPDVILISTALVLQPLKQLTGTIPIVFTQMNDPVESGFVASMARPGGNITGFTSLEVTVGGKWLEMLKEIAPGVTRAAVILNPVQPPQVAILRAIEAVAPSAGVLLTTAGVQDAAAIERAVIAFARESNGGLIVLPNPVTIGQRELINALAVRHRLLAVYAYRYFVTDGGLMSYGVDAADLYRRAAGYVDRILKGEKPDDLPVQAPTKYELVINLKAAKAIGLTIPESFLLRADVIE